MGAHRKKLCFILPAHWKARMGGAQYQAKLILDRLVPTQEYEIFYLARRVDPNYEPQGYEIIKIADPGGIGRYGFFMDTWPLLRILRRIKPDIIYQQVGCAYTGLAAYYARRTGCRMVWRISSDKSVFHEPITARDLVPHRYLERRFLEYGVRNAEIVLSQTKVQGELLWRNFNRRPTVLIRNFHPQPTEQIDKRGPVRVLWVSHLKILKRPELFVRLATDLSDLEGIEFILIGAPAESDESYAGLLREAGRLKNFSYKGERSQAEVNQELATGHILVNTSRFEGFPNTFIQAWMRRVPVVSLTVDPDGLLCSERIGVVSGDYETLRQDLRGLIQDAELRVQMGERAEAFAVDAFSEKNLERLVQVLSGR